MGTRSQVMRQAMRKTGSAAVGLALAVMVLTVMAGCARVSTESVLKSTDRLPRPELILVHDYQVSRDEVQLDSALSSRVERAVKGTPEAEDQLKVEQEVSRALTTTLVDEIRKLGSAPNRRRWRPRSPGQPCRSRARSCLSTRATRRSDW